MFPAVKSTSSAEPKAKVKKNSVGTGSRPASNRDRQTRTVVKNAISLSTNHTTFVALTLSIEKGANSAATSGG
jgi:hypothetical protein